ncbi:MAG: GIY-YIG nuclease family protein [Gammaproteobacteria bacterium]|nr:GIY-YIG nuclease family protein [Gammaproteobacteria bacterium]
MTTSKNPGRSGGSYILILHNSREQTLAVGSLGGIMFSPGWFAYVGSAFGPGGVAARCWHHRGIAGRPHWHIDYLRAVTRLQQIWFSHDPQRREHQWSLLLGRSRGASQPITGFGASDCDCGSHLFQFDSPPSFNGFKRRAYRELEDHGSIRLERVN